MEIYVVQGGDTLFSIANRLGSTAEELAYINQIPPPYGLTPGQALLSDDNTSSQEEKVPVHIGGYAYPFISSWVLEQTLPYLTELHIFSYGFTAEGELLPPRLSDDWMIALAKNGGVAPFLTLTPFGTDGRFSNVLISAVVNDIGARQRLKDEIVRQITERGFEGLDIDFEYILASDRQAFVDFVIYMKEAVGALGYPVCVALAPKTSANQKGLLYEGKDYAALGAAADYVFLMTYEWGYTYGPPMAVAPIPKVREVLDYAVTEIPPSKIHMGIPNYGYDWPLPFEKGVTKAQTLGNIQAVQRAVENGVPIKFDAVAQAPFYFYESGNGDAIRHEVWFEDVRNMEATFSLLKEYRLRGAGYWNIMQLFRANWILLSSFFTKPQ